MTRRGAGSRSMGPPASLAGMLAPKRVGGAVAAVAFTVGLFAMLASEHVTVQRVAGIEPEAITWFAPPPRPREPEPPKKKPPEKTTLASAAPAPASAAITLPKKKDEEESNAITLPPEPAIPKGFASLLGKINCEDPIERQRRPECAADKPAPLRDIFGDPVGERIEKVRMAQLEKEFGPQCAQKHGCMPMPTKTLGGMNPVGTNSPMSSGAAGLGGVYDNTGRLPPPNYYHVDPGFGD